MGGMKVSGVPICIVVLLLLGGCASQQPAKPRLGPSLVDLTRGAGGMPLAGHTDPADIDQLRMALLMGYEGRLYLVRPAEQTLRLGGSDIENLDELHMDVSWSRVRPGYRPKPFRGPALVGRTVRVQNLSMLAEPMVFEAAHVNFSLRAREATMKVMSDRDGQAGLVLMGARRGVVRMDMDHADLHRSFLAAAQRGAATAGATLESAELRLHSDNPWSLELWARLRSRWLLMPVTFVVQGRVEIDEQFHAHFPAVSCTGEDPLGALVAGFIEARMRKLQERISPLVRFGDGRTEVTGVYISTENGLHLTVEFGH